MRESLPADEPMDQRTVERLLRRLVERVEESESRYGEELDELNARLDQLSQTTETARDAGAPEDDDTFERLHTQVSNLARCLEDESTNSLDDFERLGRALTGIVRGDKPDFSDEPFEKGPEPSPFAQAAALAAKSKPRLEPAADLEDWSAPASQLSLDCAVVLDKRLVEMAEQLRQSISEAMPTRAIETLNARLDEIENQFSRSFETAPSREALEQVDRHIYDIAQQLTRAEAQLGKVNGVEAHLNKLIERLDRQCSEGPAPVDPAQLQDIAAKAATEAARIVADNSKKTTQSLDALHRDLTAMSDKSRESGDRLFSTLEALHESLKQLVQQVERGNSLTDARPLAPFIGGAQAEAAPAAPFAPSPASQAPAPQAAPLPQATAPRPRAQTATPAPRTPETRSHMPSSLSPGDTVDIDVKDQKLRDLLSADLPGPKETKVPPTFRPSKPAPSPDQEAVGLKHRPNDLVAAARRAAQAAAARAEEREERRSREHLASSAPSAEPGRRKRSWLMISASALLAVSAILLYGRLSSKPEPEVTPAATEEPAPAPADTDAGAKTDETTPAVEPERGFWAPPPGGAFGPSDIG